MRWAAPWPHTKCYRKGGGHDASHTVPEWQGTVGLHGVTLGKTTSGSVETAYHYSSVRVSRYNLLPGLLPGCDEWAMSDSRLAASPPEQSYQVSFSSELPRVSMNQRKSWTLMSVQTRAGSVGTCWLMAAQWLPLRLRRGQQKRIVGILCGQRGLSVQPLPTTFIPFSSCFF